MLNNHLILSLEESGFSVSRDYPIEARNENLTFWARASATHVMEVRMTRLDDLNEVVETYAEVYDPGAGDCTPFEHTTVDGRTELDVVVGHLKQLVRQKAVY